MPLFDLVLPGTQPTSTPLLDRRLIVLRIPECLTVTRRWQSSRACRQSEGGFTEPAVNARFPQRLYTAIEQNAASDSHEDHVARCCAECQCCLGIGQRNVVTAGQVHCD